MFLDVMFYLAMFAVSIFMIYVFQKANRNVRFRGIIGRKSLFSNLAYCITGLLFLFVIIAMFGLRYGIGSDYYSYEYIYNAVHNASFSKYWDLHNKGMDAFYIEPGYYLLNRLFPTYRLLLWAIGILIFALFLIAIKDYSSQISYAFALFIFLSTQYIYSLNGMRFVVALCFLLIGYTALIKDKTKTFIVMVLLASLFHTTMLFCLAMLFLKRYKYKGVNSTRNLVFFALILLFPLIVDSLLEIASNISVFSRYFTITRYTASEEMTGGWTWILHIVPVVLPLLIFCRKEIFGSNDTSTLFKICVTEIPFRMLGLYNTWYTRVARCAQIAQVLFIPLVLSKIPNRQKKRALYLYYIAWFIFYFAYYAIIGDNGESLPYTWIFS